MPHRLWALSLTLLFCIPAASTLPANPKEDGGFYYTYDTLTTLLQQLPTQYPTLVNVTSLGTTRDHHQLWLITITDNVTVDEHEPAVLYLGGLHGNEKPGYQVVITTLLSILENYTTIHVNATFTNRIRHIVNTTVLYFIPMANPDGITIDTRKNTRPTNTTFNGVDINRNFPSHWNDFDRHPFRYAFGLFPKLLIHTTVKYPGLDFLTIIHEGTYRGPAPLSENETRAIDSFAASHHLTLAVDYHTSGDIIGYPWFWTKDPTNDTMTYQALAANISTINHYHVLQGADWYYTLGNFEDWYYEHYGILSLLIELGPTDSPRYINNQEKISELCHTHLLVNLYLAEQAQTIGET